MPTKLLKLIFFTTLIYSFFSYALTDPNLILSSWPPYWQWQQWMWQTFFHNRPLLTGSFIGLILILFGLYLWGLKTIKTKADGRQLFLSILLAISPLFLSYNALSHDIFNYLFNAKMVVVFHADPHVKVALDYGYDDWTRFMHNTHTPAPYGYGWTALSIAPYFLGFSKLLPTWLIFRAFEILSYGWLYLVLQKISQNISGKPLSAKKIWLVFLNPLLVLEIISNQHNDLWMLVPALTALWLVYRPPKKLSLLTLIFSGALLAFSISIKLATLVLVPFWLGCILTWFWPKLKTWLTWENLALWSSILLFVPLLTERSQQFLPWYLIWSLVWLPFIKQAWWKNWLLAFSFVALLRYAPWLWSGEFTPLVLIQQKWLVWGGGVGLWLVSMVWPKLKIRYNRV